MKFWVKILIALGVVIVIAFGVWAFWFQESDEVQAYNKSSELIDYKQSLGIKNKLESLRDLNYITGNPENVIGVDTEAKTGIHLYRDMCLSDSLVTTHGPYSFWSYIEMEEYVDSFIEYYLPYLNTSTSKSAQRKNIKETADAYTKSLKGLNEEIDELVNYQNLIEGSSVEFDILFGHYKNFYESYRTSIRRSTQFMLAMVEYIDVCNFDDNVMLDCNLALGDALARSLRETTSADIAVEPKYAHDVSIVIDTINKNNNDEDIYTAEYSEYKFLKAYTMLYNNYKNVLDYVFGCNKETKEQMAGKESLSEVVYEAQDAVVVILNVIGF